MEASSLRQRGQKMNKSKLSALERLKKARNGEKVSCYIIELINIK
jgi:hypothetical protein